jgi:hypothetical protein
MAGRFWSGREFVASELTRRQLSSNQQAFAMAQFATFKRGANQYNKEGLHGVQSLARQQPSGGLWRVHQWAPGCITDTGTAVSDDDAASDERPSRHTGSETSDGEMMIGAGQLIRARYRFNRAA